MNTTTPQTAIDQGNGTPDLAMDPTTIEFLDRIFGAHGGYTVNAKISQALQTGGFHDPKYNIEK